MYFTASVPDLLESHIGLKVTGNVLLTILHRFSTLEKIDYKLGKKCYVLSSV